MKTDLAQSSAGKKRLFEKALEYYRAGRSLAAKNLCKQICDKEPGYAPALYLLGVMAWRAGEYDKATEKMHRAVALAPETAFFHHDLGDVLSAQKRYGEAISSYREALRLNPNRVYTYWRLSIALTQKSLLNEALQTLAIALRLKPDYTDALYQTGFIFEQQGKPMDAIKCFERVSQLEPDRTEAVFALGTALGAVDREAEAIACYRKVLRREPDHVYALNNLGFLLKEQGEVDQAMKTYRESIELHPEMPGPHWNLSHVLLLTGNLQEGWKEFEWRLKMEDWQEANLRYCNASLWQGESLVGKRLLIHDEQGLGDTIQFVRYLPMVKSMGGDIIFDTRKSLIPLFKDFPGVDQLLAKNENSELPDNIDYYIPLMSLPVIFNTTLATIPDTVPYLHPDVDKTRYWQKRLEGSGFKVGIVWAGAPKNPNDKNRSCPLRFFGRLSKIGGVRLIGIQKGSGAEQVGAVASSMDLVNYGPELNDFTDAMGLIENLDLVIAVDTAVAHLAGAVGKPVWLILTYAHHWPWLLNRKDSVWYPTMRIYRQSRKGDWSTVFEEVEKDLKLWIGKEDLRERNDHTG